jgi:hypothetical protein
VRFLPSQVWILVAVGLVLAFFGTSRASTIPDTTGAIRLAIVQQGAAWVASENRVSRMEADDRRTLLSGFRGPTPPKAASRPPAAMVDLPATFSWGNAAGYNWMTSIKNQGNCGSCGAFAAAAMYEARERIRVGRPGLYIDVSEQSLISCCAGCMGSALDMTLDHFTSEGCPDESCFPYSPGACDAAPCEDRCAGWAERLYTSGGNGRWDQPSIASIKSEILTNGPIVTTMIIYTDFYYYSSGVYQYVWGDFDGMHFVTIYGWSDDGDYWLAKNSWGDDWGESGPDGQHGWFRIRMGTNEADCEDMIYYVDPHGHDYPQVLSTVPQQNEPAFSRAADISVTFDSDLDVSTIHAGTISVCGDISGPYSATISYDVMSRTVLIDPDADFVAGETISVVLSPAILSTTGMWFGTGLSLGFTAASDPGSGVFGAPDDYSTGAGPSDISTGDFNNDGYPDLVSADTDAGNLTVRLGSGGTFGAPVTYAVGSKPSSVAVSDFSGDGYLDLAVFNSGSYSIACLFNNGDGSFTLNASYPGPPGATAIAPGDCDADGDCDLVGVRKSGLLVFVYRNTGAGTFETSVYNFHFTPLYAMATGDADNDGDFDLVYTDNVTNHLIILWNEGPGSFGSVALVSVGNGPRGVTLSDFNGDARLDPVVASHTAQTVSILFNNGSNDYTATEISTAPMSPQSVCASDLNGDGHPDVAVFGNTGVLALVNQGDGTFSAPTSLTSGNYWQGVAADFDVDADLDLAALSSVDRKITVLLSNECIDSDGDGVGDPGQAGSLCTVDNCPSVPNEEQIDDDGDGVGDVCDLCHGYDDSVDADSDAVPDGCDNCPNNANADQADADADEGGDACDLCVGFDDRLDTDGDTVSDGCDNCPTVSNPDQRDDNGNDIGDVCETCCIGRVGDANNSGDDTPTIGDISTVIDAKFISGSCEGRVTCFAEADVNQSGGSSPTCDDITIGDISMLIDYLFITGPESFGPLPDCL